MENEKQKSAWAVWTIIIITAFIFPLQFCVNFELPFSEAVYALMIVVGAYVGLDQLASFKQTQILPKDIKYTGSYQKLLAIMIAMFILLIEVLVLQSFFSEYKLPLGEMMICVGAVASVFVGGNKANNLALNSKKEEEKKDE